MAVTLALVSFGLVHQAVTSAPAGAAVKQYAYPSANSVPYGNTPWTTPTNAYSDSDSGAVASRSNSTNWNSNAIDLESFGLDNVIPVAATVVSVVVDVRWSHTYFLSNVQYDVLSGATVKGSSAVYGAGFGMATTTITLTNMTRTDLLDANLAVRIKNYRGYWCCGGTSTVSVDYARLTVNYQQPTQYPSANTPVAGGGWGTPDGAYASGGASAGSWSGTAGGYPTAISTDYTAFGFDSTVPTDATIDSITSEVLKCDQSWSVATTFGVQAYSGATALGTEATAGSTTWCNYVTVTQTVSSGLTRNDVLDANLKVRVRIGNNSGWSQWTQFDYVRVTVSYSIPTTPSASGLTNTTGSRWYRGGSVQVSFTVDDPNGMNAGANVYVCFQRSGESCSSAVGTGNANKKSRWTISSTTTSCATATADADNGTWSCSSLVLASGSWNPTAAPTAQTWNMTVTPASNADLTSDWGFEVRVVDPSSQAASASTTYDVTVSTNTAPTVTSLLNSHSDLSGGCAQWTPAASCTISFVTNDGEGLGTNGSILVCLRRTSASCTGAADHYQRTKWTITANGADANTVTADAGLSGSTWSVTSATQSASWTATSITWNVTIRIGDIAGKATDWRFEVTATDDGALAGSATYGSDVTVPAYTTIVTPGSQDFGTVGPTASTSAASRSVTGIKCNTACTLKIATASPWTAGGFTITPRTDGAAPGAMEFALRCSATNPPPSSAAASVGDTATAVDGVSQLAAFTSDSAQSQTLWCVLVNGNTPAGSYSGTVTNTLSTP